MEFPVTVPGFELRRLVVQLGGLFSTPKILIDDVPAAKGPTAGQFLLRRNDGKEVLARLKTINFLDPVPLLIVDGEIYTVAAPLKWYQWVWSALAFGLAIIGGALGGLIGALALYVNGRIFRSSLHPVLQYLAAAGVSLTAIIGFILAAALLRSSISTFAATPETLTSEAGRFSIVAPTELVASTEAVDVPGFGSMELYSFAGPTSKYYFYVAFSDYPAGFMQQSNPDELLQSRRDGSARNIDGTITTDAPFSLNDHPGREYAIDYTDEDGHLMTIRMRIYLVDNRLYQLLVVSQRRSQNDRAIDDFFKSFELLEN